MRDALVGALDARVPAGDVRGIYFKGSASKDWNAPCDYVPELSDLDLHVWFHEVQAAGWVARFEDTTFGLDFAQDAEDRFFTACPEPLHVPRPQLLILNHAMKGSWTRSHVLVLRGEAYPGGDPTAEEDRETLLRVSAQAADLGLDVMDKVGAQVWTSLRQVNFRVSPLPSRLLSASGAGAGVWFEPRSVLLRQLEERGFGDVAAELRAYYDLCWAAFGSGWQDSSVMRRAVRHALNALRLAAGHCTPNA